MLKQLLLTACLLNLFGAVGCSTRHRYSYEMPPPKVSPSADHSRPDRMTTAPTFSVSTGSPGALAKPEVKPLAKPEVKPLAKPEVKPLAKPEVKPLVKPTPLLQATAPVTVARKDSTATSTVSTSTAYHLKAGDPIVVYLRGIPGVAGGEQQMEDIIDENGAINLPYVGAIQAGGKTSTELEQTIQNTYIDQQIYKYITVNVVVPSRSYYVRGEIKQPGRFPLLSRVTVIQAIAAAGGFTEFANPSKVEILRGHQRIRINVAEFEKYPEHDKELESGDVIIVQRSFF